MSQQANASGSGGKKSPPPQQKSSKQAEDAKMSETNSKMLDLTDGEASGSLKSALLQGVGSQKNPKKFQVFGVFRFKNAIFCSPFIRSQHFLKYRISDLRRFFYAN